MYKINIIITPETMSQFIKEFGIIDNEIQKNIIEYIKKDESEFSPSQLYVPADEKKIIDVDKRQSAFKAIVKKELFELADKLIQKLNIIDTFSEYTLIRNDITYIKYETGGFFKPHEDYLSVTSNVIEEYTLIICANEEICEGGETKFYVNEFSEYSSIESTIPNHTLLFRKDLKHEGTVITKGTKDIVVMNLWATPKLNKNMVVVSFEDNKNVYCIPENNIMLFPNTLNTFASFQRNNGNDKKMLNYKETFCSYEDFEIIYKIFMKEYIHITTIDDIKELLDFYMISITNILINIAPKDKIKSKDYDKYKCDFDSDIVYCLTPEYQSYFCDIIKKENLPYIPFTIVFVEGQSIYGNQEELSRYNFSTKIYLDTDDDDSDDDSDSDSDSGDEYSFNNYADDYGTTYHMTPVHASFGECNNILLNGSILRTDSGLNVDNPQYTYDLFKKHNYYLNEMECNEIDIFDIDKRYITFVHNDLHPDDYPFWIHDDDKEDDIEIVEYDAGTYVSTNILYFGLELCDNIDPLKNILFHYDPVNNFDTTEIASNKIISMKNKYYDLDENNMIFLNKEHINPTLDRIDELELFNKIKNNMNDIDFIFCQQNKEAVDEFFCNESFYGKINILTVYGFMRME